MDRAISGREQDLTQLGVLAEIAISAQRMTPIFRDSQSGRMSGSARPIARACFGVGACRMASWLASSCALQA